LRISAFAPVPVTFATLNMVPRTTRPLMIENSYGRAHAREAGGAVALGVVRAAVAGAAEPGKADDRRQLGDALLDGCTFLVRSADQPVRLDRAAEVRRSDSR
jgi:hypothetical protein